MVGKAPPHRNTFVGELHVTTVLININYINR